MCECYAKVSRADPRYPLWVKVDPEAKLPLKHPVPAKHAYVNSEFMGTFYEGDPSRLTKEQKKILIEEMSKKFHVSKNHVAESLSKGFLPIKSDNVSIMICDLHFRCMI